MTGLLTDLLYPLRTGAERLSEQLFGNVVRLGVTGLRRSGKTMFVTSVVRNLLYPDRLPLLEATRDPAFVARRCPHPDTDIPAFDVDGRLADLRADPPRWPEPTRAVSEVRLSLRFATRGVLRRRMGPVATLDLDIVDYPGEWLLDLPLLGQSYQEWSSQTLALAEQPVRQGLAEHWLRFVAALDPGAPADEGVARQAARHYTDYLIACRDSATPLSLLQPGRFLEPGERAGAPMLEFCPLRPQDSPGRGTLGRLMLDRYEGYKTHVVDAFFRRHFARIDRQVVLIDLLGALNAGRPGIDDLRAAVTVSLDAFRHGRPSWLERLYRHSVDKVLFAAAKADHVAAPQHKSLRVLLGQLVNEARREIRFSGAAVETMALAAIKCTDTVSVDENGQTLACVRGIPVGRTAPTVLFPGELPADLSELAGEGTSRHRFLSFSPPPGLALDGRGLPHIRLDQALQFLIGDRLGSL